jgi:signal transduction histidine kinase
MSKRGPLQRRISIAYLMLAIGGSVLFALIAAVAVEGIEVRLVDDRLKSAAAWASPRNIAGLPVQMPAGLIFYHGESIPSSLRGLEPGVQEETVDGIGLHLLVGKDAAGDFVVVDRDSDYERIEAVVYSIVAAGLAALLILSAVVGRYLARGVIGPITTLAAAVAEGDAKKTRLPFLDKQDEVGTLARAFAARTAELKKFLVRERFFTGDVSHELRTPLTVIIGAAEILVERAADQPELLAPADRVLRAAKEAADCVTVLLLLARAPELIDAPETRISEIIAQEIERGKILCQGKPLELTAIMEGELAIFARRELLSTAIGNLIRNACQYTETGSVVVRVESLSITVEDTGPGIPAAVRSRLFDELQQYAAADSAGSGIGLALVKRICEHLGATFKVTDRPQGGSIFTIVFPLELTKP